MDQIGTRILWAGCALPVVAWGVQLFVSYGLVEWHCENPRAMQPAMVDLLLYGLSAAMLVLAVAGGWLAWRARRRLKLQRTGYPDRARRLFMANSGVLLALFLAVAIVVQTLPGLMVPGCQP